MYSIAVCEIQEDLVEQRSSFEFFCFRSSDISSEDEEQRKMSSAGGPLPIKQKIALDEAIKMESNPSPEPRSISDSIGASDNLLYIYTSGTTGLPKAVIIKHIRLCKLIDEADLEHVTLHCLYTRVTLNIKDSGSQTVGKGVPIRVIPF